ncbi:MAG TPA: class I SAM-dependent methyltransferase [Thermoanaerobaculia bacterium]
MKEPAWRLWDQPGVARTIEALWQGSLYETAHRDVLANLSALYVSSPDLKILEVGCGTGRIYQRLVPRLVPNASYTGIDISASMLEIAREKFPQGRFLEGDGYALQFGDEEFDVALAFEVLGHLPEVGPFLRELVRVTRSTAVFTVWPAADGIMEGREVIEGTSFLRRRYSHAWLLQEIQVCLSGIPLDLEVGVLHADCWAYVLRRREGPGGLAVTRLFPVPGFLEHFVRLMG